MVTISVTLSFLICKLIIKIRKIVYHRIEWLSIMTTSPQTIPFIILISIGIAAVHAMIPTHWLPFILVARAQQWTLRKMLSVVSLAGLGHVGSTTVVGFLIAWIGWKVSEVVEGIVGPIAAGILILLGMLYIGLHFKELGHGHEHGHPAELSDKHAILSLIAILTFSPCEAILPIYFAASPLGWYIIILLSMFVALGTVGGMMILTYFAYRGIENIRFAKLEHYEKLILGSLMTILGIIVIFIH
ncbi:MAG: hypothetical protein N3A72_10865 [bacterium]|nr:hypothetical protein [bacterium]